MKYIFTADWHLREDVPRCRKQTPEAWATTQLMRVREIVELANERDAALVIVGDLFHRHSVSNFILNGLLYELMCLKYFCLIVPGNHDMKHRERDMSHTAFGILEAVSDGISGKIRLATDDISVLPYGTWGYDNIMGFKEDYILLVHQLCFPSKKDIPPMVTGATDAGELMTTYGKYDMIVCGDGHTPFHEGFVINCGSILQQSVNETHEPCVWFYEEDGSVMRLSLAKDLTEIVKDVYAEATVALEERFAAFVELLQNTTTGPLSWEETMVEILARAKSSDEVKAMVMEILEVSHGS